MDRYLIEKVVRSISSRLSKYRDYANNRSKLGLDLREYLELRRDGYSGRTKSSAIFRGFRVFFPSSFWFLHSIAEIFVDEVYKFSPSRDDVRIIDCGANIGLSVLYFKWLCPDARVIAFEADPAVFELLHKNVMAFGLKDVELVNKAVWIDESTMEFDAEGALGGRLGHGGSELRNKIEVRSTRLRDHLEEPVDFLKIDIEGAEYAVLRDCEDRLKNVENLFIEYHVMSSEVQRLDEILTWVKQAGFRYYINAAAENQKCPFVSKKGEVYEMQLNISCYRP